MSLDCAVQALIRKQFIGRMPLISVKLYKNFTYQNDYKKPSKELHLGFVDRQEKELLTRDFIISNIKEVMIKYGFQYLETHT